MIKKHTDNKQKHKIDFRPNVNKSGKVNIFSSEEFTKTVNINSSNEEKYHQIDVEGGAHVLLQGPDIVLRLKRKLDAPLPTASMRLVPQKKNKN